MKIVKQLSFVGTSLLISSSLLGIEESKPEQSGDDNQVQETPANVSQKALLQHDAEPSREQRLLYFRSYGWTATQQSGMRNLGKYSKKGKDIENLEKERKLEEEKEAYLEGARAALEGEECPGKLGEIMKPMQEYFQKRASEYAEERQEELKLIAEKNRKVGKDFIEDLKKKNPSIKTTATELHYIILKEGNKNIVPTEEDRVEITYTGSFIDGTVFDKSEEGKPIDFYLNGVIPGIREGLLQIGEGGEITIYIPDSLAYGENDIPGIPAGSFLIFKIKLNKVHKMTNTSPEVEESKNVIDEKLNKKEMAKEAVQPKQNDNVDMES